MSFSLNHPVKHSFILLCPFLTDRFTIEYFLRLHIISCKRKSWLWIFLLNLNHLDSLVLIKVLLTGIALEYYNECIISLIKTKFILFLLFSVYSTLSHNSIWLIWNSLTILSWKRLRFGWFFIVSKGLKFSSY